MRHKKHFIENYITELNYLIINLFWLLPSKSQELFYPLQQIFCGALIYPSILFLPLLILQSMPIYQSYIRPKAGYTLDPGTTLVYYSANTKRQPSRFTFTPMDNTESPLHLPHVSLDCGAELEYLERAHAGTGRTYTGPVQNQTCDLLAVRQQC